MEDDDEPMVMPLDTLVKIKLTGVDTVSLDYYNMYTFEYSTGKKTIAAELMIPKKDDNFRNKVYITTKVCKVTEFVNSFQGLDAPPLQVGDYIEITSLKGEKQYFNFDPMLPDVVYTVCTANGGKKH